MSDVERQIEQWRSGLRTSDAFGASDIDELENHLREEMERLRPLGLSEMEAFLVARQRLGASAALETEYEKVNTDRRSLLRLSWMAAGVLVYLLAGYLAVGVSHAGMVAALPLRMGAAALAWVGVGTEAVAAAGLLLLTWACARRFSWSRLTARLRTMSLPWLVLLLGGLVLVVCLVLGFELLFRMAAVRCLNEEEYGQMALVRSYANLGWAILAPLLAGILVIVLRARADRSRPALP
jgi:hypothetical protein